jgi:hypothetical protein
MNDLRLRTFCFNESFSDENIDKYNASNGIIVSKTLFEEINNSVDKVAVIGLYYDTRKIYIHIIDTHNNEENIIYVPNWIYNYFNYTENEIVNYMQVYPKIGNKVKIKPHGDFYAYLDDPVTALRNGFEEYSCLLAGTRIMINVNNIPLEVEILETYINNVSTNKQPIYIRGLELEVDIESEPETIPETIPEPVIEKDNFDSMFPSSYFKNNQPNKFPGKGYKFN